MVLIAVYMDILSNYYVLGLDKLSLCSFVLSSLKEFSSPETIVFSRRLINLKTIIIQEISDDEFSLAILWFRGREDGIETQWNLLVNPFKEIFFGWFWDKSVNIA